MIYQGHNGQWKEILASKVFKLYSIYSFTVFKEKRMIENDKKLCIIIPLDLHSKIKGICAMRNSTMKKWILKAIAEKLVKEEAVLVDRHG